MVRASAREFAKRIATKAPLSMQLAKEQLNFAAERTLDAALTAELEGMTQIYPVNPKEASILGQVAYPSLAAITGPVDLALICTPAMTLPSVIAQCGAKGVKGAVVLAGGFAEAGPEGAALQAQMVAEANKYGVRIIGPNTSGIFNTHAHNNIVGSRT